MKRALSLFLAVIMVLTVVPYAFAASTFSDVRSNHWAYKEITEMASKGIIQGYSDKTFRPNNKVTRAEFAKIMIAAADVDIKGDVKQTFVDVPKKHWAFDYVEYAKPYLTGYKSGSSYYYKPDQYAVREDIAVAMVRLLGYDRTQQADLDALKPFRDDEEISKNLRSYVAIAIQTKLMQGSNNYFRPQDSITRAEAAYLLYHALIDKKDDDEKVVFPNPEQPKPEQPESVTDSFSDNELKNWLTDKQYGTWGVINKQVTAVSTDKDLDHFFLPLRWNESSKAKQYEISVDVNVTGTNGLGGLFFNGSDGSGHVVFVQKDRVTLAHVTDAKKEAIEVIASGSYKLKSSNKLKLAVKDGSVSIYMNGQFLFGQQQLKLDGTRLGLYLQKNANEQAPSKMTYLDNFSFTVVK